MIERCVQFSAIYPELNWMISTNCDIADCVKAGCMMKGSTLLVNCYDEVFCYNVMGCIS